tara:strand:+ start:474 stop:1055 length:582 start_codon:yes stop_codon:yes gene_type:complete
MILSRFYKFVLNIALFALGASYLSAEEAGMPQFNAESFFSQLFWLTITFMLLYVTVSYILLPRIRENIRLRKNKIANDLERSESIKTDIEKMVLQSNHKIDEARNQVKQMMKKSIIRSTSEYNNQIDSLKKQILNKQIETEKNLELYKQKIEKDINESALSISAIILSRLKYRNLSTDSIEKALKEYNVGKNA